MSSPSDKNQTNEDSEHNDLLYEDGDMSIVSSYDDLLCFGDDALMEAGPPNLSTTYRDDDDLLAEIINGIRESTTTLSKAFKERDTDVQKLSTFNIPFSSYSIPQYVLDAQQDQELDRILKKSDDDFFFKINDDNLHNVGQESTAFFNHEQENTENETELYIEKPRGRAAPTASQGDDEPFLLYDVNRREQNETHNKRKKEDKEFFMIDRNPFSVNHVEYMSVNSQRYQDQLLDELLGLDLLHFTPPTAIDPSFSIKFIPDLENDEEDLNSWLCFDNDMELQEFKKQFDEKYTQYEQSNKVEKGRGEGKQKVACELPFMLGEDFELPADRSMNKAKASGSDRGKARTYSEDEEYVLNLPFKKRTRSDEVYYNDQGFTYTKRQRAPP